MRYIRGVDNNRDPPARWGMVIDHDPPPGRPSQPPALSTRNHQTITSDHRGNTLSTQQGVVSKKGRNVEKFAKSLVTPPFALTTS
ncbi:hypothetical protein GWI33_002452 [Rhynchophorus ferrugineus]|uniref:Uncharacterized protein n=1 Tax=Rhynchophorus ferrugineus TaxID=354439 RepID=A0A834MN62_RHYFE|nr:hypothetical protein GWI33_002452 [Rhynchophorus ferrugineus]